MAKNGLFDQLLIAIGLKPMNAVQQEYGASGHGGDVCLKRRDT
ncbi:MAG: hypothetical protein ACLRMD_05375 [Ruminococcus sp.]